MTDPAASSPRSLGKLVILGILGLGIGAFFYFGLGRYVSLEALKANRDHLLEFTNANFTTAVVLYIADYILQPAFALRGGAIMTLAGGFLFGSILGTIFVNVGATTGATLAFLQRYLAHVLKNLRDREQEILRLRFGLEDGRVWTLGELSRQFRVTKERIRQMERKALSKIRHHRFTIGLDEFLD